MPDVVLMHFVEGLVSQDYLDSKLMFNNSSYQLTQFLQYARNPDHFICWTKEHDGTRWLELDDLKSSVCSWSESSPTVPPSEVHVVVFEKIPPELCKNKISMESNTSEKANDDKDKVLVSPMEISRNNEESFIKDDVCHSLEYKEEYISCHMDALEVKEDVEDKETMKLASTMIASDLQEKMVINEISSPASVPGTHKSDTPGRFPLKDCSNTQENLSSLRKTVTSSHPSLPTQTSLQPEKTPLVHNNSPSVLPSSLPSPSLEKSLIKVTLKKYSYSKQIQPSLSNKRRTLAPQFQPYVPKKQRLESQIVHSKPSILDFDNQSDSGYSSPSSVSSCGSALSTTSMETEQKMSVTDDMEKMEIDDSNHENIAGELEKLLPDCLLDNHRKRISVDDDKQFHSETEKLENLSQEQDDFIRNLLFNE